MSAIYFVLGFLCGISLGLYYAIVVRLEERDRRSAEAHQLPPRDLT